MSTPDGTSLGNSNQTIDTLVVEQVATPPADLVKRTKEAETRGGRAIVLSRWQQPLAACGAELLSALSRSFGRETVGCWAESVRMDSCSNAQARRPKSELLNPLRAWRLGNACYSWNTRTYDRTATFDRRPPTPPDDEKDSSELSDEVIKYQVPRPNSLDKVKHHYWWTCLVNTTASGH